MIDLQPFCLTDPNMKRFEVDKPWVQDGWQYAMDGAIAVRQKADGQHDTPQSEVPPYLPDWLPRKHFAKPATYTEPWPDIDGDSNAMIAGREIANHYAKLIQSLSDVKYDPFGDRNDPIRFTAAGGLEGIVMPLEQRT